MRGNALIKGAMRVFSMDIAYSNRTYSKRQHSCSSSALSEARTILDSAWSSTGAALSNAASDYARK